MHNLAGEVEKSFVYCNGAVYFQLFKYAFSEGGEVVRKVIFISSANENYTLTSLWHTKVRSK
ncbi:hypothetical protein VI26_00355 [Chromobacterium sp. LK1]|nr:hypothetical protein VI26_00355 [Chromobacterium sp. LK1]